MSFAGTYSYRFNGYALELKIPYHLIGLGTITLKADKTVEGTHFSTIMGLQGSDPACKSEEYTLGGTYTDGDPFGEATIEFKHKDTTKNVFGGFRFVRAGTDRFWLISTDYQPDSNDEASELVSGEAVRISSSPPAPPPTSDNAAAAT